MAKADISISINGGEDSFGTKLFRAGQGEIKGSTTIYPDSDVKCKRLLIQLIWYTEGRGTKYHKVVEEIDVFQGTLSAGLPRSYDFQFSVPTEPWSYEGHYINILWAVEVKIDVSWAKDPRQSETFLLQPVRETADF